MRTLIQHAINIGLTGSIALILGLGCWLPFRVYHSASVVYDGQQNWRFLVDSEETVGSIPSQQAFSSDYLRAVFGDNPQLLAKLRDVVAKGLSDPSKLQLRTVSAMLVTHRVDPQEGIIDVATHVIGGFEEGKRVPGFHRDGYFKHLLDRELWNMGNGMLGMLGRDMVIYSETSVEQFQRELMDSFHTGEMEPLVRAIEKPYHYTLIIPTPRRMLPPQLRPHVQTVLVRGILQQSQGQTEIVLLCSSDDSAKYTARIADDCTKAAIATLHSRFGGRIEEKAWGQQIETWWAYEMVLAAESAIMLREDNILRIQSNYNRVMVNALLKSVERLGRDLNFMTGTLGLKKDPRLVDAELATRKNSHYWSEAHGWGPNWPITTNGDGFDKNTSRSDEPKDPTSAGLPSESTPLIPPTS